MTRVARRAGSRSPRSSLQGGTLVVLLFLAGCTGSEAEGERRSVLTVVQSSVAIGDPHIVSDASDRLSLIFNIYEGLVRLDAAGAYQPGLAEAWEVGDLGRTWTFRLREGVRFHNGETMTAADVVATLGRVLDPSIGGAFGTQGVYISYLGDAELSAPDASTVRIVTGEPMADLLDLVVAMPIAPASELAALPGRYVGSGPYEIAEQGEARVVLEAHEDYWGGAPRYREIRWIVGPDAASRVDAVLEGEADIASGIGIADARRIADDGRATAHEMDSPMAIIFMVNASEGPGSDRRVRQALNYALDVEEIIARVKDGAARPLSGYLTRNHFGFDPETPVYGYDPDRARQLLAEAGYRDGLRLSFDIPQIMPNEMPELARLMAEMYDEVGISLEIVEHEDRAAYSEMVREKRIRDAAGFDSSPRSTYRVLREKLHSGLRGPWWEGYVNPEVDVLIERAETTFDAAERQAIYRRIYRMVRDDAPWIFLYSPIRYWGAGAAVPDWRPRVDGLLVFD